MNKRKSYKNIILIVLLSLNHFLNGLIIFLHGTSSAGKSSIANELYIFFKEDCELLDPDRYQGQEPFDKATKNSYYKHSYVIVDAIMSGSMKSTALIADLDICFILVHCPVKSIVEHVDMRNCKGIEKDKRPLYWVLYNFVQMYRLEKNKKCCLDKLSWNDFITVCKNIKSKDEYNSIISYWKKRFLVNGMLQYKPIYTYDLIVDTGKYNSKQCAQQIFDYVSSNNNFTAFKQSYEKYKDKY